MKNWNFIANHGLVLLYVSRYPQCTMRQMAAALGVTERSIQRTLEDLAKEGYVSWLRTGKGNIYKIDHTRELKHKLTRDTEVKDLIKLLSIKRKGTISRSSEAAVLDQKVFEQKQ
jgi:DNA-binding transcriptional regulator YhcF (GntR family)